MLKESGMSRREFLKVGGLGVGAAAALAVAGCGISTEEEHKVVANLMVQHPQEEPVGYPFVTVPYCNTVFGLVLAAGISLQMDEAHPQFAVMLDGRANEGENGWELWINATQVEEGGFDTKLKENSTVVLRYAPHAPKGALVPVY